MLICCQKDTKKAWNVTLSNVLEGTTNPNNTNERNAHAYRDAGVQSFSRVVCYAKGTTKIGSFLERKKAERFDILFQRTEGIPLAD